MKGDQDHDQDELRSGDNKRKMEDTILLAKQKAQEIAARLVSNASDSKRPRLSHDSPEPLPYANSVPSFPVPFVAQTGYFEGSQTTNKRISIPTGKVGLIIGKGGETIKYLQSQSGAKIQITKDLEADPHARTRDVELMGSSEQISRAEELINDMIGQSELASTTSSANNAAVPVQPGAEQLIMKVPNNKVALIIGKGGESIRTMQNRSGARIQIIPLHLPPGDTSTERNVYVDGLPDQIEVAKELINEVISGKRIVNPTGMNSYAQSAYPQAGNWGSAPGQTQQQPQYGYTQPGSYAQPHQPAPYYGHYAPPGTAWDQQNQQNPGYGYYGQQQQSQVYGQAGPTSHGYDQSYTQLPGGDQQQQSYVGSDGISSAQNTQTSQAYQYGQYGQPTVDPQTGYWTYPSNAGYDQTGYYQAGYGGQPQAPAPNSSQGERHQEEQQGTNGFKSSVNGTQTDGNGSAPSVQETAGAQADG